jgi:hypothetical protein
MLAAIQITTGHNLNGVSFPCVHRSKMPKQIQHFALMSKKLSFVSTKSEENAKKFRHIDEKCENFKN